jgi:tetratricopeptide (TPR) repeat protein
MTYVATQPMRRLCVHLCRGAIFAICLGSLLNPPLNSLGADVAKPSNCAGDPNAPELSDARAALERDPRTLAARFKLADALIQQGCFQEAVRALEEGEDIHVRSVELQVRIRNAKSMLNEQHYFEGLAHAEESARIQRSVLRCTKLGDLEACDIALASKPDDRDVLLAKADGLLQAGRPAEALPLYRRVAQLYPGSEPVNNKIAAAESLSRSLAARCQNGSGDVALAACRRALVHGTEDELTPNNRQTAMVQSADDSSRPHETRKSKPREYSNEALAGRTN